MFLYLSFAPNLHLNLKKVTDETPKHKAITHIWLFPEEQVSSLEQYSSVLFLEFSQDHEDSKLQNS